MRDAFGHLSLHRLPAIVGCVTILTALAGCGGKPMAPVHGKVTFKDGTIPQGGVAVVNFTPAGDSTATVRKGASGAIGADGSFEMMTREPGDGVYLGSYNVSFTVLRNPTDPTTSLIMPKYNVPSQSGFKLDVDGPKEGLHFEIEPKAAGTGGSG